MWDALHEGELAIADVRDPLRVAGRIGAAVVAGHATVRDLWLLCGLVGKAAARVEPVEQRMCGLLVGMSVNETFSEGGV
jgi:hypothetical protein